MSLAKTRRRQGETGRGCRPRLPGGPRTPPPKEKPGNEKTTRRGGRCAGRRHARLETVPSAGMTRIRCDGYDLSRNRGSSPFFRHPNLCDGNMRGETEKVKKRDTFSPPSSFCLSKSSFCDRQKSLFLIRENQTSRCPSVISSNSGNQITFARRPAPFLNVFRTPFFSSNGRIRRENHDL